MKLHKLGDEFGEKNRLVAVKLHNFTAEFNGELTEIHRSEKVSKLCEISGDCDLITYIDHLN